MERKAKGAKKDKAMEKRFIDANKISLRLERFADEDGLLVSVSSVRKAVAQTPTEDVVEVVRCKDCRYWQDNNGGYPHDECRWCHDETPDDDDFCSYGERKE